MKPHFDFLNLKRVIIKEIVSSWWVGVVVIFTYMLVLKTSCNKDAQIKRLTDQLAYLAMQKSDALQIQTDLRSRIDSEQDPLWVEMLLMQELGVVPEGQVKVLFKDEGQMSVGGGCL